MMFLGIAAKGEVEKGAVKTVIIYVIERLQLWLKNLFHACIMSMEAQYDIT